MLQLPKPLNISAMKRAAKHLVGTHDFTAFTTATNPIEDKVRTIYSLDIKSNEDEVHFIITGSGFLHNMVRIIVGTLLEIGKGTIPPDQIKQILASKDRKTAGPTAPAHALCLESVNY